MLSFHPDLDPHRFGLTSVDVSTPVIATAGAEWSPPPPKHCVATLLMLRCALRLSPPAPPKCRQALPDTNATSAYKQSFLGTQREDRECIRLSEMQTPEDPVEGRSLCWCVRHATLNGVRAPGWGNAAKG